MWILPLIGVLGVVVGFCFLTLAIGIPLFPPYPLPPSCPHLPIPQTRMLTFSFPPHAASGLYYLSELVEEHTVLSSRILTRLIQAIIALHILLLLVDGFPVLLTLFSAASHAVYLLNLRSFPVVRLTDGSFLLSCVLVVANHFLWFRHFSAPPVMPTAYAHGGYDPKYEQEYWDKIPKFREVGAFFGLCVWLVPFSLFVSLTAGDNVLPSTAEGSVGLDGKRRKGGGMAKMVFEGVGEWFSDMAKIVGYTPETQRRRFE